MEVLKSKWEESYKRCENFVFYPKEEVVKFLNRFVRKKTGPDRFVDILDFSKGVKGLDLGCGTGRQTILMREFGMDAYGVDISPSAIDMARKTAVFFGYGDMKEKFSVIDGLRTPFEKDFFDITISEAVLDSMTFELARKIMTEIGRVTKSLVFISVISGDDHKHYKGFNGEETVDTQLEKGTIQSYYNLEKIQRLLEGTSFDTIWCSLITEESVISEYRSGRYYMVLRKGERR